MITDKIVLGTISAKWTGNMFSTSWANLIAKWCVKYYSKYERAPGADIEGLYQSWASESNDKETTRLVERFLGVLSGDYEELSHTSNSDYIIDMAGKYFNQVALERLAEEVQGHIDIGQAEKASVKVTSFNRVELGGGAGINVLQDTEAIKEAFDSKSDPLIEYSGALGKFFKGALERDAFIAFLGPEKRGKTWWLLDIAYTAMLQRRKVAMFEAGDMSQNQMMRRILTRASNHPIYPAKIKYPVEFERRKGRKTCSIQFKTKQYSKGLDWRKATKACAKVMKSKLKSKRPLFKLSCHPNSSLSVNTIKNM